MNLKPRGRLKESIVIVMLLDQKPFIPIPSVSQPQAAFMTTRLALKLIQGLLVDGHPQIEAVLAFPLDRPRFTPLVGAWRKFLQPPNNGIEKLTEGNVGD